MMDSEGRPRMIDINHIMVDSLVFVHIIDVWTLGPMGWVVYGTCFVHCALVCIIYEAHF